MKGFFSEIKAAFYEFQAGRYECKADFNKYIVEMLNDGKVTVKGSNVSKIKRDKLDAIRNKQTQQVATQTM